MAIEKREGLFYEIVLRGNFGGEHQIPNALGALEGAHFIEAEALIDTDTGEVLSYKPGQARVLPIDKAIEYLGAKFADFEAGNRELRNQFVEVTKQAGELATKLSESKEREVDLVAQLEAVSAEPAAKSRSI